MKKEGMMKSKTLERLLAETSEATKQEVSAYADKIVKLRKEAEAAWEGDNPPDNWVNGYIVGALANQIQLPTDEDKREVIKTFVLVEVPIDATDFFINNIGCLRYSYNKGRQSTAIDPTEIGIYLEKNKHRIVGESLFKQQRYIIIETLLDKIKGGTNE